MSDKPTLVAYTVKDRENRKAIWTRVGAAWRHGRGDGFNIQLDALPIDFTGRMVTRCTT
jgi:hypothetical protein